MRNRILYLTRNTIPYVKELQPLAYSVAGCILMQQLDYWFERYPDGFYKFMESSEHPRYKPGESWCEELGMSADEFRTAFDKIGTRYKSKSQFEQAEDKFQGKFYCSYLDRRMNLTYYFRNHPHLDKALDALIVANKDKPAPAGGGQQDGAPPTQSQVSSCKQKSFTVTPPPPVTVNRESRFTVNREPQDTGNEQSQDTGNPTSQVTQTGILDLQETGKVHVEDTEITGSETTQIPLQQPTSTGDGVAGAPGCGGEYLVYPKNLLEEERTEIANMLQTCPDSYRQKILDEIEGAIRGNTIQKGPVPFCRALVRAVQMGTFTASLGVAVLARRHADARHTERLAQTPAPVVKDAASTEADLAASQQGEAMLEQIRKARRARESRKAGQLPH